MGQNKILSNIPNSITALNLVSGIIAITCAFYGFLTYAGYCILMAAVFDFFDGMVARALRVHSDIGKELDSLADVVSFGVAPSVIMLQMMAASLGSQDAFVGMFEYMSSVKMSPLTRLFFLGKMYGGLNFWTYFFLAMPLLIAVFSALRLAKFNLDTRQTSSFVGLPTPANAIFVLSLGMIVEQKGISPDLLSFILHPMTLLFVSLGFSYLLVCELPMFALKFKNLSLRDNALKYGFILVSLLLIVFLHLYALPIIILGYIITSVIIWAASETENITLLY